VKPSHALIFGSGIFAGSLLHYVWWHDTPLVIVHAAAIVGLFFFAYVVEL
jgi:hypothetical protein